MGTLVQIREVPDAVHRRLKARAALKGTSLSAYLRGELERIAASPTPDELAQRLEGRSRVVLSESTADARRAALREQGWE